MFTLRFLGIVIVLTGVVASLFDNVAGGAMSVTVGFIFFVFGTVKVKDIKEISAFSVVFKLKETLSDAEDVLTELREISIPLTEISLRSASLHLKERKGISREKLNRLVERSESSLKRLKADERDIERTKEYFYEVTSRELADDVIGEISNYCLPIEQYYNNEKNNEIKGIYHNLNDEIEEKYDPYINGQYRIDLQVYLYNNCLSKDISSSFSDFIFNKSKLFDAEKRRHLVTAITPVLNELNHFNRTRTLSNPVRYLSINA